MKKLRITIGNKSYEVTVEDLTEPATQQTPSGPPQPTATPAAPPAPSSAAPLKPQLPIATGAVTCPMAGSVKSILVKQGDTVEAAQPLVVLEAMKMENQITAPVAGTVKSVDVKEEEQVQEGQVLLVLE
jgi:glutaconyl-CoA decarboxylase